MELGLRKYKDIYILDVRSDLDLYNAHELKEATSKLMAKGIEKLVINLENVEYIDSSGIGALMYIMSTMRKENRQLRFSGIHGSVAKVIELTKLTNYFPIVDAVNSAVKQLDQAQ